MATIWHKLIFRYIFSEKKFFWKNIPKNTFVPDGRQNFLIAQISMIIFPKYFLRENVTSLFFSLFHAGNYDTWIFLAGKCSQSTICDHLSENNQWKFEFTIEHLNFAWKKNHGFSTKTRDHAYIFCFWPNRSKKWILSWGHGWYLKKNLNLHE